MFGVVFAGMRFLLFGLYSLGLVAFSGFCGFVVLRQYFYGFCCYVWCLRIDFGLCRCCWGFRVLLFVG